MIINDHRASSEVISSSVRICRVRVGPHHPQHSGHKKALRNFFEHRLEMHPSGQHQIDFGPFLQQDILILFLV